MSERNHPFGAADRIARFEVQGFGAAAACSSELVMKATPFTVEPYPDDLYLFTVKAEIMPLVKHWRKR